MSAIVRIAWHFMSENQFLHFESSNKPSTSPSLQSEPLEQSERERWRDNTIEKTSPDFSAYLHWVTVYMRSCYSCASGIWIWSSGSALRSPHTGRLSQKRCEIAEWGWLVSYLLPEGGKCGVAVHFTLAYFVTCPGPHLPAIFRHECILKIKRNTFSLWCSRTRTCILGTGQRGSLCL